MNFFKKKTAIDHTNINRTVDFDDLESCRWFLQNLYIGKNRVEKITLSNGQTVKMEDIPEDQIIQRARELRGWLYGKPTAT